MYVDLVKENEVSPLKKTGRSVAGSYCALKLAKTVNKSNPFIPKILSVVNNLPTLSQAQSDAFIGTLTNNPALKNKNFKMFFISKDNYNGVKQNLSDILSGKFGKFIENSKDKKICHKMMSEVSDEIMKQVIPGKNAFYHPIADVALAPKGKPHLLAHELGHAIDSHSLKGGKILIAALKVIPQITLIAVPFLAIWNSHKNKNTNKKNFIEKHSGKITFATFLPMIAEEAIASSRAIKAGIKSGLGKNITKQQIKGYGAALSSYIMMAGITSAAVALITKIFSKNDK